MAAVSELSPAVGVQAACAVLGLPRASFYRQQRPLFGPSKKAVSVRALSQSERGTVMDCLHEERFQDRSPAAVYATLLDEGVYHCSLRTMYRLLEQEGETRERRDQLTHPPYQKPELLATAPNQLWSWDITKLKGHAKWTYFYLYVILDVFSRYVVGWMVAPRETAELAAGDRPTRAPQQTARCGNGACERSYFRRDSCRGRLRHCRSRHGGMSHHEITSPLGTSL